jgi:hypothetical protein
VLFRLLNLSVGLVDGVGCWVDCLIVVCICKNDNTKKINQNVFHEVKRYNIR